MKVDLRALAENAAEKVNNSVLLVDASIKSISPFDLNKKYTPKELEPYDAMCDRFTRSVEVCLKFFRTYEKYMYGENSETIRDLLNRIEKLNFITSLTLWMDMRDVRNRIVHDYLPEDLKELYELITGDFGSELLMVKDRISNIKWHLQ